MSRSCTICSHTAKADIESAFRDGSSFRDVASRFAIGRSALERHVEHAGVKRDGRSETAAPNPKRDTAKRDKPAKASPTDARARSSSKLEPTPKRHRTTGKQVAAALLEERAVELRLQGKNYREIAAELGSTPGACCDAVERVMKRAAGAAAENVDVLRAIELERIEKIQGAVLERATDPTLALVVDDEGHAAYSPAQDKAAETFLKASARKCAITGIDAPTGPSVVVNFAADPNFQQLVRGILDELRRFPEARLAVMTRLRKDMSEHRAEARLVGG